MMIFTSIYSVVDGFFVSNFVGKTPFAAVNFIMPFLMILGAFGFMFGTGGSALISKTMGALSYEPTSTEVRLCLCPGIRAERPAVQRPAMVRFRFQIRFPLLSAGYIRLLFLRRFRRLMIIPV